MDLISPYKIEQKEHKNELKSQAVTIIDPATGWFEIHEHDDKRAVTVANTLEQQWLVPRHPRPSSIACDQGNEFVGHEFHNTVQNEHCTKNKPIMVRNPQANAVIERTHQATANMVRMFELEDTHMDEDDPWAGTPAAAVFAACLTCHAALQAAPGQLVFGTDMMFDFKHVANWELIEQRKQK